MAHVNPRLSVVLSPTVMATLSRLAAIQKRSRASVVREFLTEAEPVLARTAGLLELARTTQGQWPREFIGQIEAMQAQLEAAALDSMSTMDTVAADMRGRAAVAPEGPRAPARARPERRNRPPVTNRGVATPRKPRK